MSKWKVIATRKVPVYCIVEAETEEDAYEKAEDSFGWETDEELEEMNYYPPEIQDVEEI